MPIKKPDFDFEGFDEDEVISIKEWLEYKKQNKKMYKTQIGLNKLRISLMKFKQNRIRISFIIDNSISNNYQGLFPPKTSNLIKNSPNILINSNDQTYTNHSGF